MTLIMTMKIKTIELVKTWNFETFISFTISLLDFFAIHTYDSLLLFCEKDVVRLVSLLRDCVFISTVGCPPPHLIS
jgi:hypothetical protein